MRKFSPELERWRKMSVGVYVRQERIIVHPISKTTAGLGVGTAPFEILSIKVEDAVLGDAALRAIASVQTGIPHPSPDEWPALARPLYEAAGVKSWSTFVKGAVYCDVTQEGRVLRVESSQNKGARGGFQPIEGQGALTVSATAPAEEIGLTVRKALAISRTAAAPTPTASSTR